MSNSTKTAVLQKNLTKARGRLPSSQDKGRPSSCNRPFWGRRILPACAYDVIISFWIANCLLNVFSFCLGVPVLSQTAQAGLTIFIFLTRDFLLKGRAGGKYLLGLQIIDIKTGKPPSFGQSVTRNLVLAGPMLFYLIPFNLPGAVQFPNYQIILIVLKALVLTYLVVVAILEIILMLRNQGRRIGDFLAGTIVIQKS